jgi:outer membrane receptor for ferrienterochelin and colicin
MLSDRLAFKGGVGLYYQEPTIDESNEGFGNPLLKAERAVHYAVGLEAKMFAGLSLDLTGFYKDLSNLVSSTSATRIENGREIPLRYDNNGVGHVIGMELTLRRDPVHRLSGWVAYTLSRSERRDSGATDYRLFQYDQTHVLTAVGMWRFGRNWQLSSRFRLVSGNPMTPVTGAVIDLDSGSYKPSYGATYSARNPMFAQWDVRMDKKWVFNRFMLDLYLDVWNVTNRENVEAPDYNYDYSKQKSVKGLSLEPILGLRAEL